MNIETHSRFFRIINPYKNPMETIDIKNEFWKFLTYNGQPYFVNLNFRDNTIIFSYDYIRKVSKIIDKKFDLTWS